MCFHLTSKRTPPPSKFWSLPWKLFYYRFWAISGSKRISTRFFHVGFGDEPGQRPLGLAGPPPSILVNPPKLVFLTFRMTSFFRSLQVGSGFLTLRSRMRFFVFFKKKTQVKHISIPIIVLLSEIVWNVEKTILRGLPKARGGKTCEMVWVSDPNDSDYTNKLTCCICKGFYLFPGVLMLKFLVQYVQGSIFYSSLPKQHISIVKSKLRIIK